MNMNRDEAARALADIDTAGQRSAQLQNYRHFAPHLILWGAIWMLANTLSDLHPASGGLAWMTLSILGALGSFWLGARDGRGHGGAANDHGDDRSGDASRDGENWRWGLSLAAVIGFFAATLTILAPLNGRQQDAYISLVWTLFYTVLGIWIGWRLFAVGLTVSALIVAGYFGLQSHFFLYMGVVTGGALVVGGLWLRRV